MEACGGGGGSSKAPPSRSGGGGGLAHHSLEIGEDTLFSLETSVLSVSPRLLPWFFSVVVPCFEKNVLSMFSMFSRQINPRKQIWDNDINTKKYLVMQSHNTNASEMAVGDALDTCRC